MSHCIPNFRRRGFSLVEVLLATFILAIGLIMVATIFPVGANWTRQATEETVSQTVARDALSVLRSHYGKNGNLAGQKSSIGTTLAALPGFSTIPVSERSYQFGNSSPFPASNAASATFFWTALARVNSDQSTATTTSYDVYILVFHKGESTQTFYASGNSPPSGFSEVAGVRDNANPAYPSMDYHQEPTLITGLYAKGNYDATLDPPIRGALPPIGFYGIGAVSGTVFRQQITVDVVNGSNTQATPRPGLSTADTNVIFAPPADGTTASPLVYIYQTTVTF